MNALTGHIKRHAVGYLALLVALSGVAYAAEIAPKDSVVSKSIKNGQVKVKDLRSGAAVPGTDVTPLSMEVGDCTDTPSAACDADLGDPIGAGGPVVHARCENEPVDGLGAKLTITVEGADEVAGYRVVDNNVEAFDSPTALVVDIPDDFGAPGQVDFLTEDDGAIAHVALTSTIDSAGEPTAACDIEGVGISAG